MRNPMLIAKREFMANVRTKGFWIGVILNPVILIAMIVVPILLSGARSARIYTVIDRSGWLLPAVESRAAREDAGKLLRRLKEIAGKSATPIAEWPEVLLDRKDEVKTADDAAIELLATTVANDTRYRQWWDSVSVTAARALKAEISRENFVRIAAPAGTDDEAGLRAELDKGADTLFAYLMVGADPLHSSDGNKYVSNNLTDDDLRNWFSRLAADEIRDRRYVAEGVAADQRARIDKPVTFETKRVDASGEEKEVSAIDTIKQWAPLGFAYLLWISVFSTASMLMTGIVEEKQNKLIEVLLSSASPMDLMLGKVLGIASTGLTMVAGWATFYFAAFLVLPTIFSALSTTDFTLILREPLYLISFLVYFVLGYLLYAAILLAIGSMSSSLQDAQNMMGPIVVMLLIPLLTLVPVGKDPNGFLAKVLSYIPPFTPFVMMNRAAGPPAWWEYLLTTALMLAAVVTALWAAAKIFRVGILMTGKPPRPREILRLLRSA
ncbi:MAG: ABC transporter permease [Acidobacteriota bacterium]